MDANITTIIVSLITVLFGGGAWKFYEFMVKKKSEDKKEKRTEQTMYRDDLISRVDKLENDRESCNKALMEINKDMAIVSTKLQFLEKENNILKIKLQG